MYITSIQSSMNHRNKYVNVNNRNQDEDETDLEICAICISPIDASKTMTATTPCHHTLHFSCALLLAKTCQAASTSNANCPICRASLLDLITPSDTVPSSRESSHTTIPAPTTVLASAHGRSAANSLNPFDPSDTVPFSRDPPRTTIPAPTTVLASDHGRSATNSLNPFDPSDTVPFSRDPPRTTIPAPTTVLASAHGRSATNSLQLGNPFDPSDTVPFSRDPPRITIPGLITALASGHGSHSVTHGVELGNPFDNNANPPPRISFRPVRPVRPGVSGGLRAQFTFQNSYNYLHMAKTVTSIIVQSLNPNLWSWIPVQYVGAHGETVDSNSEEGIEFFLRHDASQTYLNASRHSTSGSVVGLAQEEDAREDALWRISLDNQDIGIGTVASEISLRRYRLVHAMSGLCLGPRSEDSTQGEGLCLSTIDRYPWQQWHLRQSFIALPPTIISASRSPDSNSVDELWTRCTVKNSYSSFYMAASIFSMPEWADDPVEMIIQSSQPDVWSRIPASTEYVAQGNVFLLRHEPSQKYLQACRNSECGSTVNLVGENDIGGRDVLWRIFSQHPLGMRNAQTESSFLSTGRIRRFFRPRGVRLVHELTGLFLEVGARNCVQGAVLRLWTAHSNSWQEWHIDQVDAS